MSSYDAWLEQPFQDMVAEADAFNDWCEENGYECETDEQMAEAETAYLEYQDAIYEEYVVDQYEAYAERMEMEYEERDIW